jgi:hypothetical protein
VVAPIDGFFALIMAHREVDLSNAATDLWRDL